MTGKIFNIQDNGELVEMRESGFVTEDDFQLLLERYPDLLAGDQIRSDEPRRWLLVKREMGVAGDSAGSDRWSLDHLFIDQDGIPTLVEVKRSTDTRLRREVVGQVLDYAANAVVYWSLEKIRSEFEQQCERDQIDADERLTDFLADSTDLDDFWQQVKTNLQAGRVRLLFVADVIPAELRRIVEFLNSQMDPAEVLAVEVRHYVGQGIKTLVPRVIGQTVEAEAKKQGSSSPKAKALTESELEAIADSNGTGDLYRNFIAKFTPFFEAHRTNVSTYNLMGKATNGRLLVMLSVYLNESSNEKGLSIGYHFDSLAKYLPLSRTDIRNSLTNLRGSGEGFAKSNIRSLDELKQFHELLSNRKPTQSQS